MRLFTDVTHYLRRRRAPSAVGPLQTFGSGAEAISTVSGFADIKPVNAVIERRGSARDDYFFAALLALIALTAVPYGTSAPWWEAAFECLIFALAGIWIFQWAFYPKRRTGLSPGLRSLIWPWFALLIFAYSQSLPIWPSGGAAAAVAIQAGRAAGFTHVLSANPFETRQFVLKMAAIVLAGVLLRWHIERDGRRLSGLVNLVIGVGIASASFALLRMAFQRDGSSFGLPLLQAGTGFGQFINHNHFAYLMEMTCGLIGGLALGETRRKRQIFYLASGVIVWLALVLSNSRGGIYSMLGQILIVAVLWTRLIGNARRDNIAGLPAAEPQEPHEGPPSDLRMRSFAARAAIVTTLLAAVVFGITIVGGDSLATRFDQLPRELGMADDVNPRLQVRRIEMWQATWRLIKVHPLVGSGFGAFEPAITEHYDASGNWTLGEAHNDYLELWGSGGIISLLLFGWFVLVFSRQTRRQLNSPASSRRAACIGALIGLSGIALHSLVDFGLQLTVNALVCTALLVIATAEVTVKANPLDAPEQNHSSAAPTDGAQEHQDEKLQSV